MNLPYWKILHPIARWLMARAAKREARANMEQREIREWFHKMEEKHEKHL